MGIFSFLRSDENRLSGSDRREYREHLAELDVLLEEGLEVLGAEATAMATAGDFDRKAIWEQAARLHAIESEIALVERGITERLTRDQLAELARQERESGPETSS